MGGFFVEDQKLYGNFAELNYFGYIDARTGVATALAAPNGWSGRNNPVLPVRGTDYVYFGESARDGSVYRYDYKKLVALPLLKRPTGLLPAYGFTMDETHVYFVTNYNPLNPSAPVGILRVRKPD